VSRRVVWCAVAAFALLAGPTWAQGGGVNLQTSGEGGYLRLLLLFTALSAAPAILAMLTGFARIIIVLFFLRAGLGNAQIPPNQVLFGLAIFLTVFCMLPTLQTIYTDALQPLMAGQASVGAAGERALPPLRAYMLRHVTGEDLAFLAQAGNVALPPDRAVTSFWVLAPAYMIGELRAAFIIGFVVYLPFLVIDLVVGATLASLGMFNVSAPTLALPFKVLLFIMVDGWRLLVGALVGSMT
jgi:flagellar biosynthesis protein FliP